MTVKSYIHLNQMYSLHKDVYACISLYKKDCIFDRIILHGCGIVALMVFFRHKKRERSQELRFRSKMFAWRGTCEHVKRYKKNKKIIV